MCVCCSKGSNWNCHLSHHPKSRIRNHETPRAVVKTCEMRLLISNHLRGGTPSNPPSRVTFGPRACPVRSKSGDSPRTPSPHSKTSRSEVACRPRPSVWDCGGGAKVGAGVDGEGLGRFQSQRGRGRLRRCPSGRSGTAGRAAERQCRPRVSGRGMSRQRVDCGDGAKRSHRFAVGRKA